MKEKDKEFFKKLTASVPTGRRNAVPMKTLAVYWGVPERVLRHYICFARMNGEFILSCPDGYFKPETLWEAQEFLSAMHRRAMTSLKSIQPLRRILKEYGITAKNMPMYIDEDMPFPYAETEMIKPFQTRFVFEEEDEEMEEEE